MSADHYIDIMHVIDLSYPNLSFYSDKDNNRITDSEKLLILYLFLGTRLVKAVFGE